MAKGIDKEKVGVVVQHKGNKSRKEENMSSNHRVPPVSPYLPSLPHLSSKHQKK